MLVFKRFTARMGKMTVRYERREKTSANSPKIGKKNAPHDCAGHKKTEIAVYLLAILLNCFIASLIELSTLAITLNFLVLKLY